MGKGKLKKFAELDSFPNVFQNFYYHDPKLVNANREVIDYRGRWASEYFGNDKPIVLELACGRGDYTLGLARLYPDKNFIGVDLKGNRIWAGAGKALEEEMSNVAFVRTEIKQLPLFFAEAEIAEIWITFPDPYLKKSKARKRLTNASFLEIYRQLMGGEGVIHLKTDSPQLFEFTHEVLAEGAGEVLSSITDIYAREDILPVLKIRTFYENMHLENGRKIKYLKFRI